MRQQPSPINNQRRTSTILINREIQHRLRIIPWRARLPQRNPPLLPKMRLRAPLIILNGRHLRRKVPRSQRVDPDLQPLKVPSQLLGQADRAGLAGIVGELAVLAFFGDAGDGRDVYDVAWFGEAVRGGGAEEGKEGGGGEEVACDVDFVDGGPVVEGLVAEELFADLGWGALGLAHLAVVYGGYACVVDLRFVSFWAAAESCRLA